VESSLFESRAYAQKELLKEDLSIRIAEAINSAGILYDNLVFSREEIKSNEGLIQEVDKFRKNAQQNRNPLIKTAWKKTYELVEGEVAQLTETVTRQINPNTYRVFLQDFYKLWLESKDQIGSNQWAKKNTKKEIVELFESASYGEHNARRSLVLFEEYLQSLKECGILYFQFKQLKAGETFRESIG